MPDGKIKDKKAAVCTLYSLLMLSVYLLFFWREGYAAITAPKLVVFGVFTGGFIIAMLLFGARPFRPTLTEGLLILYLLFSAVSALLSPWKRDAFTGAMRYEGLITIAAYVIVFLLISRYGRSELIIARVFALSMCLFCILCLIQLRGANPFGLYPDGLDWFGGEKDYSGKYIGTVGNAEFACALLCMAVPFFAMLALRAKRRLFAIPALLCAAVLLLIKEEAGYVSMFAGGLLCLPAAFPRHRRVMFISAAVVLTAAAALVYLYDLGGTPGQAHELLHGRAEDSFGSGRVFIWRHVLGLIPERPLFGGGPDTLVNRMTVYFTRGDIVRSIDTAHNEYLNILVNQGVFALVSYLAAIVSAIVKWYKSKSAASAAVGAAVLCYCIQAFFGISMFIVTIFFWMAMGYLNADRSGRADQFAPERVDVLL